MTEVPEQQTGGAGEVPGSSLTVERHDGVHLPGQYKAWCPRCVEDAEPHGSR